MPTKTTRKPPTRKTNVARPKSKSALNAKFTFSKTQLAIVIGLILVIGGIIIWRVLAATSQTEVETWTASGGNTKTVADNAASGGSYLEFLAPTVSTTPTPPASTRLKTNFPHAFARQDGTPVKVNGVNIRNVGSYSAAALCGSVANWSGFKSRGFNAVRLAVDWPSIEPTQGVLNSTGIARLDDAVNTAKANGLYVILDPIHLEGPEGNLPSWVTGQNSIEKIKNNASYYLTQIATRYKGDNNVIGIDLVNEPHPNPLPFDQNNNLRMFNTLITAVRGVDPDIVLIIEPQTGDSAWSNVDWSILTNKSNVVVSHHNYYAGGDDDGYSASGWATGNFSYSGPSAYSTPDKAAIEAHIDKMLSWLNPQRLPLYIGEYGIGRDYQNAQLWIQHNNEIFNARNISRTYWEGCSNGTMSLHINSSNTWAPYDYSIFN